MLLTITTTHSPATDLGYLLHKHPGRTQTFPLGFGNAHVFYTEASEARCTAALMLDVDPVALSRRQSDDSSAPLQPYVNDRPYVASSLLSVALAQVFGSALSGHCRDRAGLAAAPIPLEASIPAVPCRGGEEVLRRLFLPLGYDLSIERITLDPVHPEWDPGSLFSLRLQCRRPLKELLAHLYVLIPVLDDEKHYWVGKDEVDKLLRHGAGWLHTHPARELISRRYLKHQRSLVRQALARLVEEEAPVADDDTPAQQEPGEERLTLNEQRIGAVISALEEREARTVLDLGCGEGRLLRAMMARRSFTRLVGMDVSHRALEIAAERLNLERLPPKKRARIDLLHGSLSYRDKRLSGFDAAVVVEVIEHLEPERLPAFCRVVFEHAKPGTIVVTTPNAEYNARFANLPAGKPRHSDHRFEWTRMQFRSWAGDVAAAHGYEVSFLPVGPEDPELGPPTQMAVFARTEVV